MPTSVFETVPPAPVVRGKILGLVAELKIARRLLRLAEAAEYARAELSPPVSSTSLNANTRELTASQ